MTIALLLCMFIITFSTSLYLISLKNKDCGCLSMGTFSILAFSSVPMRAKNLRHLSQKYPAKSTFFLIQLYY